MTLKCSTAVVALLTCVFSHSMGLAHDGPPVSRVVGIEGEVHLKRANTGDISGEWIVATVGEQLYPDDQLKTGEGSSATLQHQDGKQVTIPSQIIVHAAWPPDSPYRQWQKLGDDIGVLLSQGDGLMRGRLYVRIDDEWTAVILEDPEDRLPEILPLKKQL